MKIKNNIEPKEIKRIKELKKLKFLKVFKRSQKAGGRIQLGTTYITRKKEI